MVLGVYFLVGGFSSALASGPHGRGQGRMGHEHGDFGGHHMMNNVHHDGFSWIGPFLFLLAGIVILIVLVKWLKKKSKASSMQQFIDTSLMSTPKTISNQVTILDEWEKSVTMKKEEK